MRIRIVILILSVVITSTSVADDTTWHTIQSHVLGQNCTNCHSTGTSFARQSGLVLTEDEAYNQLVDVAPKNSAANADGLSRVSSVGGLPGLAQSFFWEKVNAPEQDHFYQDHPSYGAIMPFGSPSLTNGELALVKEWILAGAPETGVVADPLLLDDTTRYEPPEFVALDPPENGIQFHLGPFDVWPSEVNDREFLYFEPYETTEDLFINQYEISYRPGSHHFILYNYPEGQATPEPQVYRDVRNQQGFPNFANALQLGRLFPFQFFVGTQTPFINYHLPKGVALRLPAGSGFDLNTHSVNRTGTTQVGEVYVNLHTVGLDEINLVADYANFGNSDINLPPNEITTISKTFTFGETRHILQMWSHSHEHTLEFRIEGVGGEHDGELLYWTNDWEHPPLLELDPPLSFEAGDQVRLVTTYNNWTDELIEFGPLSSDEMQFMFYIYTDELLAGDANGDFVVDDADFMIWDENKFTSGTGRSTGDFNGDGKTDVSDFNVWNDHRTAATTLENVPEPGSSSILALWILLALAGVRRRWR
jgi:hypothetical protein